MSKSENQILFDAIIDSQSVKTAAMLNQAVGYDAGKKIKGRKRFVTVDTLGLILSVFVTAANQTEREGGKVVLQRLKDNGTRIARLHTVWAARFGGKLPPKSCLVDGGFTGDTFMMWVMDLCHWVVQVVRAHLKNTKDLCCYQNAGLLNALLAGYPGVVV